MYQQDGDTGVSAIDKTVDSSLAQQQNRERCLSQIKTTNGKKDEKDQGRFGNIYNVGNIPAVIQYTKAGFVAITGDVAVDRIKTMLWLLVDYFKDKVTSAGWTLKARLQALAGYIEGKFTTTGWIY